MPRKITTSKEINVAQNPGAEVPVEVLAESIVAMSKAMQYLNTSRLRRETILTLIHARSKVAKRDIDLVLNNLTELERIWLKPKA